MRFKAVKTTEWGGAARSIIPRAALRARAFCGVCGSGTRQEARLHFGFAVFAAPLLNLNHSLALSKMRSVTELNKF